LIISDITMNKILKAILVLALALAGGIQLQAQKPKPETHWLEKHPVDIAIGNFSVGMPFTKVFISKYYPLVTAGTEFYYLNKNHSKIFQAVRFGGYYNAYSTSAVFVNTDIGYRLTFGFGLFADAGLGIGYSHLFRPNAIYKMNDEGQYEQVADWGQPSVMADFSLSAGYDFSTLLRKRFSVYFRYGNYIQLFYNPDIPALPQNSFQVGTRFYIIQKNTIHEPR
jgi:hypothetical protein